MGIPVAVTVDWKTTQEVVGTIVSLLTLLVATAGLFLAWRGYSTWSSQIVGKTGHDIARAVLSGALKVRDEIARVRRPGAILFTPEAEQGLDAATSKQRMLKRVEEHYSVRLDRLQEALVPFELAGLEAEAMWGKEGETQVAALVSCVHDLRRAVWEYLTGQIQDARGESHLRDPNRELLCYWIVCEQPPRISGNGSSNAFGDRVTAAIAAIEQLYRPKLHLQHR